MKNLNSKTIIIRRDRILPMFLKRDCYIDNKLLKSAPSLTLRDTILTRQIYEKIKH